jgi:hypothetical protein
MVKLNSTDRSGKNGREEARSTALYLLVHRVELCIGRCEECKNARMQAELCNRAAIGDDRAGSGSASAPGWRDPG